jgi:hypothetical protein
MRRTAAGETEQGRRDLERLHIVKKRREEDRLKREAEGRAPGWTPNGVASSSDDSDIDSDVSDIDSDVSDDEIKESKLFNKNSSTLIQNIPNYSENTNLFDKNEDNTNLLILDNKISCEYCYNKYSSKISLNLHIKYCQTIKDYIVYQSSFKFMVLRSTMKFMMIVFNNIRVLLV